MLVDRRESWEHSPRYIGIRGSGQDNASNIPCPMDSSGFDFNAIVCMLDLSKFQ